MVSNEFLRFICSSVPYDPSDGTLRWLNRIYVYMYVELLVYVYMYVELLVYVYMYVELLVYV